jgi:hypothetical protein
MEAAAQRGGGAAAATAAARARLMPFAERSRSCLNRRRPH